MDRSRSWGGKGGGNAAAEFMNDVFKTFLFRNADIKNILEVIFFLTTEKEQFALGSKYTDIGQE